MKPLLGEVKEDTADEGIARRMALKLSPRARRLPWPAKGLSTQRLIEKATYGDIRDEERRRSMKLAWSQNVIPGPSLFALFCVADD